jgi:hypothetical protein
VTGKFQIDRSGDAKLDANRGMIASSEECKLLPQRSHTLKIAGCKLMASPEI